MQFRMIAAAAAALSLGAGAAEAASVLSGRLTVDNAFYAYLSTSPKVRGTLIASGNDWGKPVNLKSVTLKPGKTYYLHIEAINYGGPGAFLGAFKLSDDRFHFANGRREILTGASGWSGGFNNTSAAVAEQPWVEPRDGVFAQGAWGVGPWGKVAGMPAQAQWIWPSDGRSSGAGQACGACTVDFSITISPTPAKR